jgi:hypothetical protein
VKVNLTNISRNSVLTILLVTLSAISAAETNQINNIKDKFEVVAKQACITKELSTEIGLATSRSAIDEKCTCYGQIFVDELFNDAEFIEAQKSGKNDSRFQAAMRKAVPDERLSAISNFCTQKAMNYGDGSPKRLIDENFDLNRLSSKPGLQGVTRDAFIRSAHKTCVAGDTSSDTRTLCGCLTNNIADRLSEQNLVALLSISASEAREFMTNLQLEALTVCDASQ